MTLALCWSIYSLELRKVFSYRVDFWVKFLAGLAIDVTVAWFLWRAVFEARGAAEIGGYTFAGMFLYSVVAPLVTRVASGPDFGNISVDIYDGSLTRYIVYPMNFFVYKVIVHLVQSTMALLQLGMVFAGYLLVFGAPEGMSITPASLAMGVAANLLAAYLYFSCLAAIELTAFWFDTVWNLNAIFRFTTKILGGGFLPLALFPAAVEKALLLLPFNFMIYFPIRSYFGQVPFAEWCAGMALGGFWALALTGGYLLVWRKGSLQYTGVGI